MPPVTLREYVEIRLEAMERAVSKAEAAADRRFEAVNEMRAMVTDAARSYMPRAEFETAIRAINEKLEFLQNVVMPRGEYAIEHKRLEEKVDVIDKAYVPREENERARQFQIDKNDAIHKQIFNKIESMQRTLWIGVGIVATLQFIVDVLVVIWRPK